MSAETPTITNFTLPSLGSDMESGTVIEWLVAVGDTVTKGDVLLRVDTEKADIDIETWEDGVIEELVAAPGETLDVGATLARIAAPALESLSIPTSQPTGDATPATDEPSALNQTEDTDRSAVSGTPASRAHVPADSQDMPSTGAIQVSPRMVYWPTRRRNPAPLSEAPSAPLSNPQAQNLTRAERRQQRVAELMERSNRDIPHFHLVRQIDMTMTLESLNNHNETVNPGDRVLPAAALLHAVAGAALGSPVNGHFDNGPIDVAAVHLGVAVNLRGGGLVTPVIPSADRLDLGELMRDLKDVVARAKAGRMSSLDLTAATLTVTNLGDTDVDRVFGVIRPPQRALVGFGTIAERPVIVDGQIVGRKVVDVTLSADHRVVNGHAAARFLQALASRLENPDSPNNRSTP